MSIYSAMYSGVSGLMAEDDALGVIGNNLANTNTVGFKESRAIFETVLGGSVGQEGAIGGGGRVATAPHVFAGGSRPPTLSANGTLVNPDGMAFQGYMSNGNGTFSTNLSNIQVNTAALPPKPST